jgi:hypothetical protein
MIQEGRRRTGEVSKVSAGWQVGNVASDLRFHAMTEFIEGFPRIADLASYLRKPIRTEEQDSHHADDQKLSGIEIEHAF